MPKGGTSVRSRPALIDHHRHEDRKAITSMSKKSQKKKRSRQRAPKRSRITVMGISVAVPEHLGPPNAIPAVAARSIRETEAQAQEPDTKSKLISAPADLDATSQALAVIATNAWRAKARLLDPERWLTTPAEPWVEATLAGGWRAEGDGVYVNMDEGFSFLYLNRLPCKVTLDHICPSIVENLRASLASVEDEHEATGLWHQMESFRYAADGVIEDGRRLSLRTVWVAFEEEIYCALVQSTDKDCAESFFKEILEGLRIASATPG